MSGGESASGNAPTPNQDASASSQGAFNSLSAQSSHLGVTGAQIEWEETRKEDEMEVEKIWYGRLAKMQKIHERELQELREQLEEADSRILSYITARESDKNFWQSKLQQTEADTRRLAKATKVLLGWMKYVRLPCGQYSVKPLERAEAEASAAIDEAIK